ncbi:MAG: HAD-IIB family hydrolase, partial [Myxococcales bacterium]|nr:HAD-IIB family hydrolase [Myxococcales bacterium]
MSSAERLRPLSDIPPETLREVRGVIFDVDDTVTRKGRLEAKAFQAMWNLQGAGLRLVPVTGRPLGWVDVIARQWPVDVAVGENGAGWVWVDGGVTREGYFHSEEERRSQAERVLRIREQVATEMPEVRIAGDQRARRCDVAFDVGEHASLAPADRARLVALIESEGAAAPTSSVHTHAVVGAWNKADGVVRAMGEALRIDPRDDLDRWIFVGDSGNDAPAFE